MKKTDRITYWTVKSGWTGADYYYKQYNNAKALSVKDFYDRPVKHTVTPENFKRLESVGAFED